MAYVWLRWAELQHRVPLSRSQVDRIEKAGRFPPRYKPTPGQRGVCFWREDQVEAWLESIQQRPAPATENGRAP
jgi:predicted DNA-binding transcriptional regulator AlpA